MRTLRTLQALTVPSPPRLSLVATDFTLCFHLYLSEVDSALPDCTKPEPTKTALIHGHGKTKNSPCVLRQHHLDIHLSPGKDCKKRKMKKALRLQMAAISCAIDVQSVHLQSAVAQVVQAHFAWRWCSKSCRRFNSPRLRQDHGWPWMTKGLHMLHWLPMHF